MRCPICSESISNNIAECPSCGTDLSLCKKIIHTSRQLYNRGLELANLNNLTGAIQVLSESVKFDKEFIDARNLLGLVYFGIGEIGEAVKHWSISMKIQPDHNPAKQYIEEIKSNNSKMKKLKDAVSIYNDALPYVRQKSEDLAIIRLKKAVSLNPRFIKALCLLALCYIQTEEPKKARQYLKNVLSLDISNSLALKYYKEVEEEGEQPVPFEEEKEKEPILKQNKLQNLFEMKPNEINRRPQLGLFVVGLVLGLAVMGILILPGYKQSVVKSFEEEKQELNATIQKQKEDMVQYTKQIEELEKNQSILQSKIEQAEQKDLQDEQTNLLMNAVNYFYAGETVNAALTLAKIDRDKFVAGTNEVFDYVQEQTYYSAAQSTYQSGYELYQRREYANAEEYFLYSIRLTQEEYFSDNAIYLLGRCYEELGDTSHAIEQFQKVVDQFPYSDVIHYAEDRLSNLTA